MVCEKFAASRNLVFNSDKSFAIAFGSNALPNLSISLGGGIISWVFQGVHLGIKVHYMLDDGCIILSIVTDLYARANSLFLTFRFNTDAMFYLFRATCSSLYGLPCCRVTNPTMRSLYVSWNKVVRKLFRLPFRTHTLFLPIIADVEHLAVTVRFRVLKFAVSCIRSENVMVQSLSRSVG